ncbi:MAG TPA: site-specific tyrosine recombinase/integron integrase [Spirochaetota bacterium]|nr:site-specific tyrosine recombinase/integron integrase [Spirochaetota bacterium]
MAGEQSDNYQLYALKFRTTAIVAFICNILYHKFMYKSLNKKIKEYCKSKNKNNKITGFYLDTVYYFLQNYKQKNIADYKKFFDNALDKLSRQKTKYAKYINAIVPRFKNEIIELYAQNINPEREETVRYEVKKAVKLGGKSPRTYKAYISHIENFLTYFDFKVETLTTKEISDYIYKISNQKNYSQSTTKLIYDALHFYYKNILKNDMAIKNISIGKRRKKIHNILNKKEIKQIITYITDVKQRLIFSLLYATGMRVSELSTLKIKDISLKERLIHIKEAKGKKDRYVTYSPALDNDLQCVMKNKKYTDYLFTGKNGRHFSNRTVQKIVHNVAANAGIQKRVHPHLLRHTFATHMLEQKCNPLLLKKIMGHSSLTTTRQYVHMKKNDLKNVPSLL